MTHFESGGSSITDPRRHVSIRGEFVALMALMTSLVALSTDIMLPALATIGDDLGVARANDAQLIVSALFLGLAAGQMVYGPLSDRIGRKRTIYGGLILYVAGCALSIVATSFPMMLAGRVLQGVGVAGPRIVVVAMVRDQYEGRAMARTMSLIMTLFILVPVVAPALGQGILLIGHWRAIFFTLLLIALIALVWLAVRQPETLPRDRRRPFSLRAIAGAIRETCTHRVTLGYMIAAGLISGSFLGYLNSAAQIFQVQYGLGARFPLYFAVLALAIGGASLFNARLVMRYGMRRLSKAALVALCVLSASFFLIIQLVHGHPPLWALMGFLLAAFFSVGILFGNFNALAMEPLGHMAGGASGVIGTFMTLLSVPLGAGIGRAYDGTASALVGGFALLSALSLIAMAWAERGRSP